MAANDGSFMHNVLPVFLPCSHLKNTLYPSRTDVLQLVILTHCLTVCVCMCV